MILMYGSQQDYDNMTGKESGGRPAWDAEATAAVHKFMGEFGQALIDSGEYVDTRGLAAPVHSRRVQVRGGVPVVTDGPYPETQEVLAGYWIVECASFDRATEIAAGLGRTPDPTGRGAYHDSYVDVRPIVDGMSDLDF
jgi:hypothetical protein